MSKIKLEQGEWIMDAREMTQQVRLNQWAEILRMRKESGKTVIAWCAENNIHIKTYYYWQQKLRKKACKEYNGRACNSVGELITTGFTEVKIKAPEPEICTQNKAEIQIEIGTLKIAVSAEYPVNQLTEILKGLISSC